jgi:uncharacterized protein YndB with AHSA1/START domain
MRMFLLILIVVVLSVLGYAATRPDTFRLERTTTIKAPPERVFALINDFQKWSVWSPWDKKDPGMKRSHSGAAQGLGAIYSWEGNKEVGSGRMEIVESKPVSKVSIRLNFLKPFESQNTSEFTLRPKADQTEVVWAMYGPQPFIAKLMSLVVSMEKMVGPDFEQGLAAMKKAAETP